MTTRHVGRFPVENPTHLMAFDLETTRDTALIPPTWDPEKFPKPAWHRVVAISVAIARISTDPETGAERYDVQEIRSGGQPDWTEAALLSGFWSLLASRPFRLVSWNGQRFDIPVLVARSLLAGLDASVLWRRGDRWSGYLARYAESWHCDVQQSLSLNGATQAHGLEEAATALGYPGKAGEHGGAVEAMVAAGEIERVRRYCDADAANTMGCYFSWARLTGRTDHSGYEAARRSLAGYLRRERAARPHLGRFLDAWRSAPTTDRPEDGFEADEAAA
jgi:predicted PolB exonuclease-like 3'-5' exonuclease